MTTSKGSGSGSRKEPVADSPPVAPDIIRRLQEIKFTGVFEVHQKVASFKCYRKTSDGSDQEVVVEVFDSGPEDRPSIRYHVVATSEEGRSATCNGCESIDVALMTVHWNELDPPEQPTPKPARKPKGK
jgi:hypothetical protein